MVTLVAVMLPATAAALSAYPSVARVSPRSPSSRLSQLPSTDAEIVRLNELLRLVNLERHRRGLPPLRLSDRLNQVAQHHTEDMAFNDFFSHLGSEGTTLQSRLAAADYPSLAAAENIAAGHPSP
ncbi:MAG: CAP domain-containing protein, partial [Spirulinaceae cyanobacterium RM2_2_10]|nr:CAP domain-containing protein [Spirulinaceae cyanobacterium RM2_2_10]